MFVTWIRGWSLQTHVFRVIWANMPGKQCCEASNRTKIAQLLEQILVGEACLHRSSVESCYTLETLEPYLQLGVPSCSGLSLRRSTFASMSDILSPDVTQNVVGLEALSMARAWGQTFAEVPWHVSWGNGHPAEHAVEQTYVPSIQQSVTCLACIVQ